MKFVSLLILIHILIGCMSENRSISDFPRLPKASFTYPEENNQKEFFFKISQFHKDSIDLDFRYVADSILIDQSSVHVHLDSSFHDELNNYYDYITIHPRPIFRLYLDSALSYGRLKNVFREVNQFMLGTYSVKLYTLNEYIKMRPTITGETFYSKGDSIVYCHNTIITYNDEGLADSLFACDTLWDKFVIHHSVSKNNILSIEPTTGNKINLKSYYDNQPDCYQFYTINENCTYQDYINLLNLVWTASYQKRNELELQAPNLSAKEIRKKAPIRLKENNAH